MNPESVVLMTLLLEVDDKLDSLNQTRNGINLVNIISDITALLTGL